MSTPRTDAAWSATFDSEQMSAGRTARALREHSQQLETELATPEPAGPAKVVVAVSTGSADGFLQLLAGVVEAERLVVAGLKPEMPCRKMHENRHRAFREALSMATAYFQLNTKGSRAERAEAAFADAKEECKNVRLKWHAIMGTCAAKEDAILELGEELARLRPELEKVYALVTPVGFDLPGGIFETAQAVTKLRAERDQFRAEIELDEQLQAATEASLKTLTAERDRLRAEVNEAHAATHHWCNRAERAEDNLAALEQCHDDNCRGVVRIDADLAKERARLDWVFRNCKVIADGYAIHDREDLGVAMKEDAK